MSGLSHQEQARGRAQLREWVVRGEAPRFLWPLAGKSETTEELARAMGPDNDARLAMCHRLLHEDHLGQPLYLRRLWGHMARVLCARKAKVS